jgi:arginine repressor
MKTNIKNLLKIENSFLVKHSDLGINIVTVYKSGVREIYYRFIDRKTKKTKDATICDNDEIYIDIHPCETIEDVLEQIYYLTGVRIKLKENETI